MGSKNEKNKKNRKQRRARRSFTDEFRADVVRLCQAGGESIAEVAKRLDLTASAVRGWVRTAEEDALGGGDQGALTASEKEELQRLRRENKTLKMEREILKKAAAFFARESP
jgi:transposase